jgi:hypothetical protein
MVRCSSVASVSSSASIGTASSSGTPWGGLGVLEAKETIEVSISSLERPLEATPVILIVVPALCTGETP